MPRENLTRGEEVARTRARILSEIREVIETYLEESDRRYRIVETPAGFELRVRIDPPLDYVSITIVPPREERDAAAP